MRRIALSAITLLLSALTASLAPGVVVAQVNGAFGPEIPCPTDPNIIWRSKVFARNLVGLEGVQYNILSYSPTFVVGESRFVDNPLDAPISATFTSSQSTTITVSVTVGTTAQFVDKLQRTISVQILMSRTTSIGVNATVEVPPHRRITGMYGTEAFGVSYSGQVVWKNGTGSKCWDRGTQSGSTTAPTVNEGWRFALS